MLSGTLQIMITPHSTAYQTAPQMDCAVQQRQEYGTPIERIGHCYSVAMRIGMESSQSKTRANVLEANVRRFYKTTAACRIEAPLRGQIAHVRCRGFCISLGDTLLRARDRRTMSPAGRANAHLQLIALVSP